MPLANGVRRHRFALLCQCSGRRPLRWAGGLDPTELTNTSDWILFRTVTALPLHSPSTPWAHAWARWVSVPREQAVKGGGVRTEAGNLGAQNFKRWQAGSDPLSPDPRFKFVLQ